MKRSGLKPPTLEQVIAWRSKPRKRIRARGSRKERQAHDEIAFKSALIHRSAGFCEATELLTAVAISLNTETMWRNVSVAKEVCGTGIHHDGCDPHHLWPEDRRRGIHDPERGLWLCRRAHDWAHANPARARELGLLRPDRDGDAA